MSLADEIIDSDKKQQEWNHRCNITGAIGAAITDADRFLRNFIEAYETLAAMNPVERLRIMKCLDIAFKRDQL